MSSISASVSSVGGRVMPRPTLLTQTSMWPNRASASSTARCTSARLVTSATTAGRRRRSVADRLQRVGAPGHQRRPRAVASQPFGQRGADAAARAGDDHDLSVISLRRPRIPWYWGHPPGSPRARLSPLRKPRVNVPASRADNPLWSRPRMTRSARPLSRLPRPTELRGLDILTLAVVAIAVAKSSSLGLIATHLGSRCPAVIPAVVLLAPRRGVRRCRRLSGVGRPARSAGRAPRRVLRPGRRVVLERADRTA